jgi:hypothetical protein
VLPEPEPVPPEPVPPEPEPPEPEPVPPEPAPQPAGELGRGLPEGPKPVGPDVDPEPDVEPEPEEPESEPVDPRPDPEVVVLRPGLVVPLPAPVLAVRPRLNEAGADVVAEPVPSRAEMELPDPVSEPSWVWPDVPPAGHRREASEPTLVAVHRRPGAAPLSGELPATPPGKGKLGAVRGPGSVGTSPPSPGMRSEDFGAGTT